MSLSTSNEDIAAPFWEAASRAELRFQQCGLCGHLRFPPSPICPRCLSEGGKWVASTGKGEVQTYVVFHHSYNHEWSSRLPYNVVLVQLDDGPRMFSNFVSPRDELRVGARVRVVFSETEDRRALPQFELDGP